MSDNDELSSDEERSFEDDEESDEESSEGKAALSAEDRRLIYAVDGNDADAAAAAVQQAIRAGANVNAIQYDMSPLLEACRCGYHQIIHILLKAGADARWSNDHGESAISTACFGGNLSTVQLLINHDSSLLEIVNNEGRTPLFSAIDGQDSDMVRFLLDIGADPHHVDRDGETALMTASTDDSLEIARLLLAAGVDVEARDGEQQTALHYAANNDRIEIMRELIFQHNANMFAVDRDGRTPFDSAGYQPWDNAAAVDHLVAMYGNKLTQNHGSIALHELCKVAEYSFAKRRRVQPPLNPLQIILPLGKLTLKHLRTLLHILDPALIRNRDDTGKLPIHVACQTNAPVEVLALLLELDPAVLHVADNTGALPIHLLCGNAIAATEYASVRYLVEQGGVGTLAARNRQGLLPLHLLCGSTNPPLRAIQYLIQSFPGSVAVQANAGEYSFMLLPANYLRRRYVWCTKSSGRILIWSFQDKFSMVRPAGNPRIDAARGDSRINILRK